MSVPPHTPLDRTDRDFHDIDPATHRPFSGGHPDGVWLIAIVFSLAIALTLLRTLAAILAPPPPGEGIEFAVFLPAVFVMIALAPPVALLFQRKKTAATWLAGVAVLAVSAAIAAYFGIWREARAPAGELVAFGTAAGMFLYAALYARGLKQQKLLR